METTCLGGGRRKKQQQQEQHLVENIAYKPSKEIEARAKQQEQFVESRGRNEQQQDCTTQYHYYYQLEQAAAAGEEDEDEQQQWDLQQRRNHQSGGGSYQHQFHHHHHYHPLQHHYDNIPEQSQQRPPQHSTQLEQVEEEEAYLHQHCHYYQNQLQKYPCYQNDCRDPATIKTIQQKQKNYPIRHSTEHHPQIMHPLSPHRANSTNNSRTTQQQHNQQSTNSPSQGNHQESSLQHHKIISEKSTTTSPTIAATKIAMSRLKSKQGNPSTNTSSALHPSTSAPTAATATVAFLTPSSNLPLASQSSSAASIEFPNDVTTCGSNNNANLELLETSKVPSLAELQHQMQHRGQSTSNKKQSKQQQHHQRYPILDLDAIEVCTEQQEAAVVQQLKQQQKHQHQQQPPAHVAQQISLIKSLRGRKLSQPMQTSLTASSSSNIKNFNYNLMAATTATTNNESCSSSQSSNSGCGSAVVCSNTATLEANVKWPHNMPTASGIALHPDTFFMNNETICDDMPLQHPHPFHHDYSYAYYEPGAAMRHSNIPTPEQQQIIMSPSRAPPPNSIRALLSKGKKNKILVSPATRQSYQAKLASSLHENFYEEIESESKCGSQKSSQSSGSLSTCVVEEEFRRVQSHHRKILGELNLSVEAMLMPKTPPNVSPRAKDESPLHHLSDVSGSNSSQSLSQRSFNKSKTNKSADDIDELLSKSMPQDSLLSPVCTSIPSAISFCAASSSCSFRAVPSHTTDDIVPLHVLASTCTANTDLDSGFSGSSGASYIGNLRYHKTNAALSNIISSKKKSSNVRGDAEHIPKEDDPQELQCKDKSSKSNKQFSVSFSENNFNTISDPFANTFRSSKRSIQSTGGRQNCHNEFDGGSSTGCTGNPFIIQSSHGKKILSFSMLNNIEQMNAKPTTPTESKARSFWAKKGWKKSQASASTSSIDQTGKDETKLNAGSWEDPLPITKSSSNVHHHQTIATAQLHNSSLRRIDALNSRASYNSGLHHYRYQHNQLILSHHLNSKRILAKSPSSVSAVVTSHTLQQKQVASEPASQQSVTQSSVASVATAAALGGNNLIGVGGGNIGGLQLDNQQIVKTSAAKQLHKKLEHTPSARTVNSSDGSWCSERDENDITSEDDDDLIHEEDELDLDNLSDRSSTLSAKVTAAIITTAANAQQLQQQQQPHHQHHHQQPQRNSQLRSTFNKAKQHLSFDKWRTSVGGGGNNNNSSNTTSQSTNSANTSPSHQFQQQQSQQTQQQPQLKSQDSQQQLQQTSSPHTQHSPSLTAPDCGGSPNSNNSQNSSQLGTATTTTNQSATMPTVATAAHHPHPDTTTPGETPGGRLSRWFSIRRGSTHQYDIGGRDGTRHSTSSGNSIDTTDTVSLSNYPASNDSRQNIENISPKGTLNSSSHGVKMPQLPENEDDSNHAFDIDLMLPPGSRANGTNRPHNRLIMPTLPAAPPGLSQQQLKRRHIVAAVVHSENSYVATLQRLVNNYKKPLEESSPPILNSSKIATLFHRLPEILQSHKLFRIALADAVRNWDRDEKLGDVFVTAFSKPQILEVYSGFINNFSAAMELAKMEAKRKSALADFFKVKQISAHDRLSFFGLMVKPVQRFPQFILFLQDLLKYTPQGHHDRMSLQLALTQLESLAEMLNERKREAEQYQAFKEMLGHITGTFNTRSLTSSDNSRQRYLLREDNVTQMEFNQSGFIVKSKQRRLLLLNDKVICVSVAPKQSHDFGATEKLSFKWMYPVTDVEIVDNSTSATLSRILTAGLNRGGSLKSNSSSCNNDSPATILTNGADNLCNEMSTLMYDYEVISRINDLVGTLKGSYKEINTNITRNLMNTIQGSIQRKDEEMAWVDSCCLQMIARNKSGKEETLTFQTENPNVKKEWITELRLAQLALDPNNSPAWEMTENDQRPSTKMPLFVKAQPVYKSQHQSEVRCGCYYSITNDHKVGTARRRFKRQNYLWICTTTGQSSHISVLSQHHQQAGNFKDVGSFDLVETQVTCMEYIKAKETDSNVSRFRNDNYCSLVGDLVWMGTDSRKILIYSATNPEQEEQIAACSVSGIVQKIIYHLDSVFVALSNSTILLFRRSPDGVWQIKEPQTITMGIIGLNVSSILPINMNVYASCGSKVAVLNAITGDIQKSFEVQRANQHVNLMAHSGIGLWISLKNSSIICLYHTETFKHLQDINVAANVLRVKNTQKESVNNSSIHVTSLLACKGLLWVGTNVGIALTIPLPRLEGVPIISGGVNISCHAHFGPITFLLPLVPKSYPTGYKQPSQAVVQSTTATLPIEQTIMITESTDEAQSSKNSKNDVTARENDSKKDDDTTVILRRDLKEQQDDANSVANASISSNEQDSPGRSKLDKQNSLDSFSAKIKAQLANSPALRRKRYRDSLNDSTSSSRMSKTLPRGLGSPNFFTSNSISSQASTMQNHDHGYCDVYGLYGKLIFVKEDYDAEEGTQGNLIDMMYEGMRRSDPELAAIPAKVSTLDRRLRMKASRPRSLDLSNWSVDSKSSSLYTSSGSEESMGIRLFGGRSVSRNSSSASHKTSGNGSDLGNISENGTITTADIHHNNMLNVNLNQQQSLLHHTDPTITSKSDELNIEEEKMKLMNKKQHNQVTSTSSSASSSSSTSSSQLPPAAGTAAAATLKRKNKSAANKQNSSQNNNDGTTLLTLMGGRGYWRHVWYTNTSPGSKTNTMSGGTMSRVANSNDAHIVIWENKL